MAKRTKNTTTNALEILDAQFPLTAQEQELSDAFGEAMEVAAMIYQARTQAGLSQRQLAKMVGTTASVICRLEDADYEGHSMTMLRRVAAALDHHVELRFVPNNGDELVLA